MIRVKQVYLFSEDYDLITISTLNLKRVGVLAKLDGPMGIRLNFNCGTELVISISRDSMTMGKTKDNIFYLIQNFSKTKQ